MEKINVVLCEGQHDIAFISRILKAHSFEVYNKKISKFISPLNDLFELILKNKKIGDRKLGFQSEYKIPSVALTNETSLTLFHNLGGDSNEARRTEVINMYKKLKGEDDFTKDLGFEFRFIYIFDADDAGVVARVTQVNNELNLQNQIEQGNIVASEGFEFGCYIFHNGQNNGDLEDIIISMISASEEEILVKTGSFITDNILDITRTKEFICTPLDQSYKDSSKFKFKKSKLSIAGQLQFSGMSNSVFISNTDFLTLDQLTSNHHCTAIKRLFI